jgi:Skp family chaperone for outer membrane proteins
MALGGVITWAVRATRTSKDAEAVRNNLEEIKDDHEKRLDGHDDELRRINQDFVPRRELSEKLELHLGPINKQLEHQTRMLEYAVMNKKPDAPTLSVGN